MARSISVKVPTATLIEKLENKLAEIEKAEAEYPAKVEQYQKDKEAYVHRVQGFLSEYLKTAEVGESYDSPIRISQRSYFVGGRVDVEINTEFIPDFPEAPEYPEKPNQRQHYGRDYTTQSELIKKNLNILRMTSQEEVNASTYGAIMEIL
jgi:hypothetical protein